MSSPLLLVLAAILSVCSASRQQRSQIGSPLIANFARMPGQSLVPSFGFAVPGGFGGGGSWAKRELARRACATSNLEACANDPTVCCEVGGKCCGGGRCCPAGNECQTNSQGAGVCCLVGDNCFNLVPNNPCADPATSPCVNYNFCCPSNNACSVVNGVNTCTPIGGGGGVTVSAVSPTVKITSKPAVSISPKPVSSGKITSISSSVSVQDPLTVTTTLPGISVVTTRRITTTSTQQPATVTAPGQPTPTTVEVTVVPNTPTPSTATSCQTVTSSIQVAPGVFSATTIVLSSTVVYTPAPTPTPAPAPSSSSSTKPVPIAIIAGASVGGTLFLVALGLLIFFCARHQNRPPPPPEFITPPAPEPTIPVLPHRYHPAPTPTPAPAPRYSAAYAPPNVVEIHSREHRPHEIEGAPKHEYTTGSHELPTSAPAHVEMGGHGYGGGDHGYSGGDHGYSGGDHGYDGGF